MTLFHENGRISLNYVPIFKIQSLACSGERGRFVQCIKHVARDDAREMTSRARVTLFFIAEL